MYEIPAYLVWGFLESGKSTLIKETLSQDYFNDGEKTMILTFEEGEVEYDKEMLEKTNSFVINIEKIEDFTKEFVRACQRNYYPDRVIVCHQQADAVPALLQQARKRRRHGDVERSVRHLSETSLSGRDAQLPFLMRPFRQYKGPSR